MAFEVEITNNIEDRTLIVESNDIRQCMILVDTEYPTYEITFIGEVTDGQ